MVNGGLGELARDVFDGQGTDVEPEFYCSVCGRKIKVMTRQIRDGGVQALLDLVTVQEGGKRYTGVICEPCSEQDSESWKERRLAYLVLEITDGVTIRIESKERR